MLLRPHSVDGIPAGNYDVAILVRREDADRNALDLDDIVPALTAFFAGESSGEVMNTEFWDTVQASFHRVFERSISDAAFAAVGVTEATLAALLNEA